MCIVTEKSVAWHGYHWTLASTVIDNCTLDAIVQWEHPNVSNVYGCEANRVYPHLLG